LMIVHLKVPGAMKVLLMILIFVPMKILLQWYVKFGSLWYEVLHKDRHVEHPSSSLVLVGFVLLDL
jgi:hypothetical protein